MTIRIFFRDVNFDQWPSEQAMMSQWVKWVTFWWFTRVMGHVIFYPWPTKETCHPLRNGRLVHLTSFNVLQLQLLFHQHLLQQHLWHRWRTVYWRKSEVMRLNRYCVMLKVMFLIPSTGGAAWRNVSLIVWLCPKLAGYSSIFCWMLATFQCI